MRRKLAAVLCTLLCLTAFTGCSADEVGYLQWTFSVSTVLRKNEGGVCMRRKLAAVLCTLLCLTAFTGCSADEVGYLQMSVDMMNCR